MSNSSFAIFYGKTRLFVLLRRQFRLINDQAGSARHGELFRVRLKLFPRVGRAKRGDDDAANDRKKNCRA